jgi:hypothetical protein
VPSIIGERIGFHEYRTTSSLLTVIGGTASVAAGSSVLYAVGILATGGAGLLNYVNNQVIGKVTNGSFTGTASLH